MNIRIIPIFILVRIGYAVKFLAKQIFKYPTLCSIVPWYPGTINIDIMRKNINVTLIIKHLQTFERACRN